ncbi:AH receptor-interacting protein-like [Saccostrea echinata]|uniref:AH receptor-interacting protein-like n=1 Tax=Saccostrea echinata TaxID=191078 RepID=UPI002A830C64|nr:AH receptor-interacting protein-like [Saccostrea echinata]
MAEDFANLLAQGIEKRVLYAGKGGQTSYEDGTKLYFHFRTEICDEENTVLDDSHKYNKPMEIILGKKFKLEVWETCLRTMRLNEVACFTVEKSHTSVYPVVSKTLREYYGEKKAHSHNDSGHCCGMMMAEHGVGFDDLNELMKNPKQLRFILELVKVERPEEYEKDSWTLTDEEKLQRIPVLKEQGNKFFLEKKYPEAAEKYFEALSFLEQLVLKEKPEEPEWNSLEDMKTPFLLNYAQCKLFLKDFYPVIEHTSTVLKREPENVKALFRRAKAHVGAWNPLEAREDFSKVMTLDPSLSTAVQKELKNLEELQKQKDSEDRNKLKGLFS